MRFLHFFAGGVKDSVVGEERLAQYLLATLNIRGTPLHWRHSYNKRIEEPENEFVGEKEGFLRNSLLKRKMANRSDVRYIEVKNYLVIPFWQHPNKTKQYSSSSKVHTPSWFMGSYLSYPAQILFYSGFLKNHFLNYPLKEDDWKFLQHQFNIGIFIRCQQWEYQLSLVPHAIYEFMIPAPYLRINFIWFSDRLIFNLALYLHTVNFFFFFFW